mmetsp:Transcript_9406/g.21389  ORF Transcript_9406/g.21389 Transcript_9406/m.21389 type:complete len:226 (-) Transcript_9406:327-1004(-)
MPSLLSNYARLMLAKYRLHVERHLVFEVLRRRDQELLSPILYYVRHDCAASCIIKNVAHLQIFDKIHTARVHVRPKDIKRSFDLAVAVAAIINHNVEHAFALFYPMSDCFCIPLVADQDANAFWHCSLKAHVLHALRIVLSLPELGSGEKFPPKLHAGTRAIAHIAAQTDLEDLEVRQVAQGHQELPIHGLISMVCELVGDRIHSMRNLVQLLCIVELSKYGMNL